jgi:hypothetical protein
MNIPKQSIAWLVNRMRVGTPAETVKADIRKRCTATGWTERKVAEAENYGVKCHRKNLDLYRAVMSGRL